MGGGGGNTTTATSSVPDWLKPQVQSAFRKAEDAHSRGALSKVAPFAPGQTEFLTDVSNEGISGHAQRLLANQEGQALANQASSNTLNSARGDALRAQQQGDLAAKLATQDLQARNQAYDKIQAQRQAIDDKEHTGLQRLFGYYGSPAAGTQQTSTQGGGK